MHLSAYELYTFKFINFNKILIIIITIKYLYVHFTFLCILLVLWGCASKSNIAIMQRYQSKFLRLITNAPRYVNNQTLHTDLQIPFVHTVFQYHIRKHRNTLESHPNPLVEPILHSEHNRRLKRRWTFDATN